MAGFMEIIHIVFISPPHVFFPTQHARASKQHNRHHTRKLRTMMTYQISQSSTSKLATLLLQFALYLNLQGQCFACKGWLLKNNNEDLTDLLPLLAWSHEAKLAPQQRVVRGWDIFLSKAQIPSLEALAFNRGRMKKPFCHVVERHWMSSPNTTKLADSDEQQMAPIHLVIRKEDWEYFKTTPGGSLVERPADVKRWVSCQYWKVQCFSRIGWGDRSHDGNNWAILCQTES